MLSLLIRVRLASILNAARAQVRRSPWLAAGLAVAGVGLFAGVLVGFTFLFRLAAAMSLLSETLYQVFYFLFLFLLAGSTPFVAATLLLSSDYSLLFAAPIPARAVIAAKLLDAAVTNSLQFTVLGAPALVAAAIALDVGAVGWLLLLPLICLFVLVPALITALGLLLLMTLLGAARIRSAITALNGIMAAVACITIVLESPHLPVRPGGDAFASAAGDLAHTSPAAHAVCSAWFVDALAALSGAHAGAAVSLLPALLKIAALTVALWLTCLLTGERAISPANLSDEGARPVSAGPRGGPAPAGPVGALLAKDWRYLCRDSILLSQLGMPIILFAVPFILTLQDPSRKAYGETFYFASAIIGVILFMQTSILSLSSIGLESRAFWIVMSAPIDARRVIAAKFLFSTLCSAAVGIALTVIAALVFAPGLLPVLVEIGLVGVSAAALSGLGVGLSAAFPRFTYENPAHRVSAWALVLGFFASVGYVAVSGILFATAWLVALNLPPASEPTALYAGAAILYLAISAIAVAAPIRLGALRIEGYQWEH
jgi:ABC-2 type transport system permease protein